MRSMGDLDVLIRDMDSQKMQKWMEARGYDLENNTHPVHDEYKKSPYVLIELHRKLIDANYTRNLQTEWIDQLTEQIWDERNLVKGTKHIYQLKAEDFYIYHLLHFYKHFMYAGSGIRPLADIYIFLQKNGLNRTYLQQQLKVLRLSTFAERMEQLAFACFSGQILSETNMEEVQQVVRYLTDAGTYGDKDTFKLAAVVSQGTGSFTRDLLAARVKKCFPSRQIMQQSYPKLYRYPWMLPFYWVMRAARILFLERYKLYAEKEKTNELMKSTDVQTYNEIENVFRIVGITTKSK